MKRFTMIALLVLVLVFALCACGRRDNTDTSNAPDTSAATANTTRATEGTIAPSMPILDPTLDTNIPDPTVDSNSNDGILDDTNPTGITNGGIIDPME